MTDLTFQYENFFKLLFAPFLWLVQSCNPVGEPVNPSISDNHYYNKGNSDIHYVPMGNWFELGNSPMNVDVQSFKVLTRYVAKDRNNVYYERFAVKSDDIDLTSFFTKEGIYMDFMGFDKNHVYVFDTFFDTKPYHAKAHIIEDAQPETYIKTDIYWAKDDSHHFYRDKIIDVDYKSFVNINERYSRDDHHIYHHYVGDFSTLDASTDSFEVLGKEGFAKDDKNVFSSVYHGPEKGTDLIQIPIPEGTKVSLVNDFHIRIGDDIYYFGTRLKGLDAESAELIYDFYIKDDTQVFYQGQSLADADAASFRILDNGAVGDKDGIFIGSERKKVEP